MATYDSLSMRDKEAVQNFVNGLRLETARIYKEAINAGVFVSAWNGGISSLVASLDAGEKIPNTTNRDGAMDVTKENLSNNLMSYVTTVAGLGTTGHRDNISQAAGLNNLQVS